MSSQDIIRGKPCIHCGCDEYSKIPKMIQNELAGGFLDGYGHTIAVVVEEYFHCCVSCGYIEGAAGDDAKILPNPIDAYINSRGVEDE